jgi:RNA polymerase sigma-70 factor (ECF subfamily)
LTLQQDESSACLIEKARTDRTAFAELFRLHYDEIFRYCARRVCRRETAEDITSQVFMKMINKFSTFMGDQTAFRYWLFRIACNEINSYFRTAGRQARAYEAIRHQPASEQPDAAADCRQEEENALRMAFLHQALAALSAEQQDIITLRFFEGLNSEQIGGILGMKATTVRSRLARALSQLKKSYQTQQVPEGLCWYDE